MCPLIDSRLESSYVVHCLIDPMGSIDYPFCVCPLILCTVLIRVVAM